MNLYTFIQFHMVIWLVVMCTNKQIYGNVAYSYYSKLALSISPLLPRTIAMDHPDYDSVSISNDGQYLSYMAPWNNVMNIYINRLSHNISQRITNSTKGRIGWYKWTGDNRTIIFSMDTNGDENWRLYLVNIEWNKTRILTNMSKVKAVIIGVSYKKPDLMIIGLNDRNASYHDAYELNLTTGDRKLIFKNDQFKGYLFDQDLKLRILIKENDNASTSYFTIPHNLTLIKTFDLDDSLSSFASHFDNTGRILYWVDSTGRDKGALISENMDTGERIVIYEPKKSDIEFIIEQRTGKTLFVMEDYMKPERIILDNSVQSDFQILDTTFPNLKA